MRKAEEPDMWKGWERNAARRREEDNGTKGTKETKRGRGIKIRIKPLPVKFHGAFALVLYKIRLRCK
jgi:hypothetical protein